MQPISIDTSPWTRLLPLVLSIAAGSVDVISFLGLNGLFAAHITGNLAILAARIVTGRTAGSLATILAIPVFIVALALSALIAAGLEASGRWSLRPLLALQLFLLAGFLAISVVEGSHFDPTAAHGVLAGMLGVSAMGVQNALVRISLKDSPATTVMTTDITRFVIDVGRVAFAKDPGEIAESRTRARRTWPAIFGFFLGCALGALFYAAKGFWSLTLPTGLALLAFAISLTVSVSRTQK